MFKDTIQERIFIKVSILLLRAVAPLSIFYCCARAAGWTLPSSFSGVKFGVDVYAICEAIFFLAIYTPRRYLLNRPAPFRGPLPRSARKEGLEKTWDSTYDVKAYVSQWFYGAPLEAINREDAKDFISWRAWNSPTRLPEDDDELDEHLAYLEGVLNHTFPPGRSGVRSMMVTFESLSMLHKPLFWYVVLVGSAEIRSWISMSSSGLTHYRLPMLGLLSSFPFRWPALLSANYSPTNQLSYWYRPHEAKAEIPVLFVHGIGIGFHPYLSFFRDFIATSPNSGLIAIEILPICSRVSASPFPTPTEIAEQVSQILQYHGWSRCILMTHSYGSVTAAHLLKHSLTAHLIEHCLFIDPVTFSFHAPDIAYNFLRRPPTTASEIQLHYFAGTDPDVVRALTRSFVWHENSLWLEDIEDRKSSTSGRSVKSTIMICGKDIIIDTLTLGRYMTRKPRPGVKWYHEKEPTEDNDSWKRRSWNGNLPVEVVWSPELNHGEAFDEAFDRGMMIKILQTYARDCGDY